MKRGVVLLEGTKNFTVLIKNSIRFELFDISRNNILGSDKSYLRSCKFSPIQTNSSGPLCPVFVVGDIIQAAGQDYMDIGMKGGVIGIVIDWTCDLDKSINECLPKYSFRRLDDNSKATIAPGWNFRFANYHEQNRRTLIKAIGIRFVIMVTGQGGRFSFVPLLVNIGSGVGLLAIVST